MEGKIFNMSKLNLACGDLFVESSDWINLDWAPKNKNVIKANLLDRLDFPENYFNLVYTSHFLEHTSRKDLEKILKEIYRVLNFGGIVRIVVPDLEEMCREYISKLDEGEFEKASFVTVEILDQLVRQRSGGELNEWRTKANLSPDLKSYIALRNGTNFDRSSKTNPENILKKILKNPKRIKSKLIWIYCVNLVKLAPKWFQYNHVSLVEPGEKHFWVHDFYSISEILKNSGFTSVIKQDAFKSLEKDFPFYPLDIDEDGRIRKGQESMYIEAIK